MDLKPHRISELYRNIKDSWDYILQNPHQYKNKNRDIFNSLGLDTDDSYINVAFGSGSKSKSKSKSKQKKKAVYNLKLTINNIKNDDNNNNNNKTVRLDDAIKRCETFINQHKTLSNKQKFDHGLRQLQREIQFKN